MSTVIYQGKDVNSSSESATYWFDVNGEVYGVVEGRNAGIVDCDGYTIDDYDNEDNRQIQILLEAAVTENMRG